MLDKMKGEFLKLFMETYPTYAHKMRSCLHSWDEKSPSPWHLEDDCWSHTMMVFNALNIDGMDKKTQIGVMLAALVHDAGKPLTRMSHKPGRVSFRNHANAGLQFAAEVSYDMFPSYERVFDLVTYAVSHHLHAYDIDLELVERFVNCDYELMDVLTRLMEADLKGQISIGGESLNVKSKSLDHLEEFRNKVGMYIEPDYVENCDVQLYCGIPGCGKDHYAESENREILSFDKLRMEWINTHCPKDIPEDPKQAYVFAFEKTKKVNLHNELESTLIIAKKVGAKIAICNTFCPSKSRKKMVKLIKRVMGKDTTVGCKYIFTWLDQAISNDHNREDKTVGQDVIGGFAINQMIPTMAEGFSKIDCTFNDYKPGPRRV